MKIAIAQLNPTIGDLVHNAAAIQTAAEQAVDQGAGLLLTPELSLCGYPPRDLLLDPSFIAGLERGLQQLCADLPPQLHVLVGTVTLHSDAHGSKPLLNAMAYVYAGQVQQRFHKHLLPTYDVFDEDRYFAAGCEPNILDLKGCKIGVTICEDLWNNSDFWGKRTYAIDPVADLISYDVDLVINLSASPFCVGKQALREAMLYHHAQQYHCPLIYANQVGGNDDLIFDGRSVAVNRRGEVIGRARGFAPDLLMLTYDPHTHDLQPSRIEAVVTDANAEIWSALVLGVRDYALKCGFKQAVLGLSGGIDSSLVAAIATAALGPENVLGVLMPSPYSSDHSIQDAEALARNLGMPTIQLAIATAMQTYETILTPVFAGTNPGVAEENIQARIRGNLLMALANKFSRLLISTGNKSEMAVGYCTLYGDMNGGLAAIVDVPKTRVYKLCHWLNSHIPPEWGDIPTIIPASVLTKPPSAELKPGQVDQDSLPSYEVLDDILYRYIDNHQASQQIIDAGHSSDLVHRIIEMVKRAEFKRRQAPPGLKITDRAFGSGWRMPIASKLSAYPQSKTIELAEQ